jgi:MFS family permease
VADQTANVIAWSAGVTAASGTLAGIIASRATTPLSQNSWFILFTVIAIASFAVLLLIGPRLVRTWWRGRKKPDAPLRPNTESAPAEPRSVSLRDFQIGGHSDFKLRSSASTLAEGGGMSGWAKFDVQHFPGHPELFGLAIGSEREQQETPQAEEGPPGETRADAT